MKGFRFYAEWPEGVSKRRKDGATNVVALSLPAESYWSGTGYMMEAVVAVYGWPDSAVCGGSVQHEYLRKRCKRVSESVARQIHPSLFAYLESET